MHFSKYLSFLALILVALLAFHGSPVGACSCLPAHPQTQYCAADYVIACRVIKKSDTMIPGKTAYKVKVIKTYKINEEGKRILQHNRIVTANNSAACGANLDIGKLYVIAGRAPQLNLCNYIREYKDLSVIERRGLLGFYRKGCKCEIKPCWGDDCLRRQQTHQSCKWSPFAKCETIYSACLPTRFRTPEGNVTSCAWRKTRKYLECMAEP